MNEDYTFHEAVNAIDRATITGRPFPRAFFDNSPTADGRRMISIDFRTVADRAMWLDYFGARVDGIAGWTLDWHGWHVSLTAHYADEDSEAGAVTSAPSPASVDVLAEGEAVAADLMCDPCIATDVWVDAVATRVSGMHRAEDLDRLPTVLAALDPDATIQMPCVQSSRHETHGAHTRHVDAYSRYCLGYCWDAPTAQMATVTS